MKWSARQVICTHILASMFFCLLANPTTGNAAPHPTPKPAYPELQTMIDNPIWKPTLKETLCAQNQLSAIAPCLNAIWKPAFIEAHIPFTPIIRKELTPQTVTCNGPGSKEPYGVSCASVYYENRPQYENGYDNDDMHSQYETSVLYYTLSLARQFNLEVGFGLHWWDKNFDSTVTKMQKSPHNAQFEDAANRYFLVLSCLMMVENKLISPIMAEKSLKKIHNELNSHGKTTGTTIDLFPRNEYRWIQAAYDNPQPRTCQAIYAAPKDHIS